MKNQEWNEVSKRLTEKVMDGLTKSVEEDQLWWKENGEKVREDNLKELNREKQRKIYIFITPLISVVILSLILFFYMSGEVRSQTGNMNSSPYNMENSIYNMENSPYNMRNSPYNMDNSQYNMNSKNGVYDNQGNRTGYQVTSPSGVTNYYDNKGNRTGYTPSQR